jgi:hypothetical protein
MHGTLLFTFFEKGHFCLKKDKDVPSAVEGRFEERLLSRRFPGFDSCPSLEKWHGFSDTQHPGLSSMTDQWAR